MQARVPFGRPSAAAAASRVEGWLSPARRVRGELLDAENLFVTGPLCFRPRTLVQPCICWYSVCVLFGAWENENS